MDAVAGNDNLGEEGLASLYQADAIDLLDKQGGVVWAGHCLADLVLDRKVTDRQLSEYLAPCEPFDSLEIVAGTHNDFVKAAACRGPWHDHYYHSEEYWAHCPRSRSTSSVPGLLVSRKLASTVML